MKALCELIVVSVYLFILLNFSFAFLAVVVRIVIVSLVDVVVVISFFCCFGSALLVDRNSLQRST